MQCTTTFRSMATVIVVIGETTLDLRPLAVVTAPQVLEEPTTVVALETSNHGEIISATNMTISMNTINKKGVTSKICWCRLIFRLTIGVSHLIIRIIRRHAQLGQIQ